MNDSNRWMVGGVLSLAALAALAPTPASACGGFFCNQSRPVDQSAEEIVFDVNEDANTTTMTVKIEYSGPSDDFAWVVPVPAKPELTIGTDALFPVLSSLRAQWQLIRDLGVCSSPSYSYSGGSTSTFSSSGGGGVDILSTGVVGPYETVVLQATDSTELVGWLTDNGFDLPSGMDDAVAPYVADGQYFVALRLAKDRDAGDLQPIQLTYPGTGMAIPIQLTSLAATPDMGLRVYVLGQYRAVPQSYLHLVLNELAVDWWTGGANIDQVLVQAADEAGGHGFFTDYSGPTAGLANQIWSDSWSELPNLVADAPDALTALSDVIQSGVPIDDDTLAVLSDNTGLPIGPDAGVDLYDVLGCLGYSQYYGYYSSSGTTPSACYLDQIDLSDFDAVQLAADLHDRVLEPRQEVAQRLTHQARITRMTSSLSPVEMTVDPTFVFNPDMPGQPLVRSATETYLCEGDTEDFFDAPRVLTLSDGRQVDMPSLRRLSDLRMSSIQWLQVKGLTEPLNERIEQAGSHGLPDVIRDNANLLWSQLGFQADGKGCGCASGGAGASGMLAAGILVLGLRRRRQA